MWWLQLFPACPLEYKQLVETPAQLPSMSEVADKHKMEERWCPVFVLLLMWMVSKTQPVRVTHLVHPQMAVGGMGAVIKPRDSHTWAQTEWTEVRKLYQLLVL